MLQITCSNQKPPTLSDCTYPRNTHYNYKPEKSCQIFTEQFKKFHGAEACTYSWHQQKIIFRHFEWEYLQTTKVYCFVPRISGSLLMRFMIGHLIDENHIIWSVHVISQYTWVPKTGKCEWTCFERTFPASKSSVTYEMSEWTTRKMKHFEELCLDVTPHITCEYIMCIMNSYKRNYTYHL